MHRPVGHYVLGERGQARFHVARQTLGIGFLPFSGSAYNITRPREQVRTLAGAQFQILEAMKDAPIGDLSSGDILPRRADCARRRKIAMHACLQIAFARSDAGKPISARKRVAATDARLERVLNTLNGVRGDARLVWPLGFVSV